MPWPHFFFKIIFKWEKVRKSFFALNKTLEAFLFCMVCLRSFCILCRVARWYYFYTENLNLGTFWRAFEWNMLVYFMTIRSFRQTFDISYGHLVHFVVHWYIFHVLVYCTKKNLAALNHALEWPILRCGGSLRRLGNEYTFLKRYLLSASNTCYLPIKGFFISLFSVFFNINSYHTRGAAVAQR
jgi:hypothetical protein